MEKETYKVAKVILHKFTQTNTGENPAAPVEGGGVNANDAQLKRRANLNNSLPVTSSSTARTDKLNTSMAVNNTHRSVGRNVHGHGAPQDPSGKGRLGAPPLPLTQPPVAGGPSRSAPGPPLPRPVLPRERGYLDKFVEFLVGDGPANRFALICRQCQSHNGMALREEFEFVAYRCCYCYYWNPARKQRPVAPKLADQPSLTASAISSGSNVSGAASVVQSNKGSVPCRGKDGEEMGG